MVKFYSFEKAAGKGQGGGGCSSNAAFEAPLTPHLFKEAGVAFEKPLRAFLAATRWGVGVGVSHLRSRCA